MKNYFVITFILLGNLSTQSSTGLSQSAETSPKQSIVNSGVTHDERSKLVAAISAPYKGGFQPKDVVLDKYLKELSESQDESVQSVAQLFSEMLILHKSMRDRLANSAVPQAMMRDVLSIASSSSGETGSDFATTVETFNKPGSALSKISDAFREVTDIELLYHLAGEKLRGDVLELLDADSLPELPEDNVSIDFLPRMSSKDRVGFESPGVISLRNKTSASIHDVVCIVKVEMDESKINASIRQVHDSHQGPQVLANLLGMDERFTQNNIDVKVSYLNGMRKGRGTLIGVNEIKKGAAIRFNFAALGDILFYAESIVVSVIVRDVGVYHKELGMDEVIKDVKQLFAAKSSKSSRRTRR